MNSLSERIALSNVPGSIAYGNLSAVQVLLRVKNSHWRLVRQSPQGKDRHFEGSCALITSEHWSVRACALEQVMFRKSHTRPGLEVEHGKPLEILQEKKSSCCCEKLWILGLEPTNVCPPKFFITCEK